MPTHTGGGVGAPWAEMLRQHEVSPPGHDLELGSVELQPARGASAVTSFAFAASLDWGGGRASVDVVAQLARKLGDLTHQRQSVTIATPLLGTGDGRLDPIEVMAALARGFTETAEPSAHLRTGPLRCRGVSG